MTIDSCRRLFKVENILQICEGQHNEKEEVFMEKERNKSVVFALLIVGIALGLVGIVVSEVFAGEGGGNNYPGGNEDYMVGALPPPGTGIFINYLTHYHATTLRDNSGSKAVLNGPPGNPQVDFSVNALANVFRYVKVTNIRLFGGDVLWHALLVKSSPAQYASNDLMGI